MSCEIQIAESKGPLGSVSGDELTVGRPFGFKCTGEFPDLNVEKLELRLEESDRYKLKLLKFEKQSNGEANLLVTSYQAGNHQIKAVQLVDPDHSVLLGDLQFTVKSVINPQQQPPPEPYGPMGPLVFGLPLWFKLALGSALLLGVALAWWRLAKKAQRKKWLLEMKLYERVLSPMAELGKSLRQAQKDLSQGNKLVQELDDSYRIYLARIFEIPTRRLSDRQILKDIRSYDQNLYEQEAGTIQKALEEMKRALLVKTDIAQRDLEQLLQLVRRSAEHIDQHQSHKKGVKT